MADVHRRLVQSRFLSGLSPVDFAGQAAVIMGDINYVHPFRDGDGRTQLQYLKQLAGQAGHTLDLAQLGGQRWVEASVLSHATDYSLMVSIIAQALAPRG